MTNTSLRIPLFSVMSSQLMFLLLTIGMLSLINVSKVHACTKSRLCHMLCCGGSTRLTDVGPECDNSCNECKTNHSVGGVCERRNYNDQVRRCNPDFTCTVTCRNECDSVGREDDEVDEDDIGFGSGDDLTRVTPALHASPTDYSENPPLTFDSSWRLSDLQIILIIVAVCLCFLIICMLLLFAIRFVMNGRKLTSPPNRGQYPTSVFYTSGKMTTVNQGSMFNQPSSDFSTAWC